MPAASSSTAAILLLALALASSTASAFLLLPSTCLSPPKAAAAAAAAAATRLAAHSHLQTALLLMQQNHQQQQQQGPVGGSNSRSSRAGRADPRVPPAGALGVHFASDPDPVEENMTGTGDRIKVLRQAQKGEGAGVTTNYLELQFPTKEGISLHDITPQLRQAIKDADVSEGWVNVVSRHTTTAVTLNECESRLMDDVRQFLLQLAPPSRPYLHNDIHLRPATEDDKRRVGDWDLDEWRAQEPKNCHSHLLSMLLGNTLMLPVTGGKLAIGRWQSVMVVELDGPRERTVGVQVAGFK